MKIIKQHAEIVRDWKKMNLYERCEFAGRISHKSDDKIKEGSAEEFCLRMVRLGHESVFEFARVENINVRTIREDLKKEKPSYYYPLACSIASKYPAFFIDLIDKVSPETRATEFQEDNEWIPVLFITNRAISHQLVRYRREIVFIQESQRYVKFRDGVEFIDPSVYFSDDMYKSWIKSMRSAEKDYIYALFKGHSAQAARLFLPNSTATRLIAYASPKEWRHIIKQRTHESADPMIRQLMEPLRDQFEEMNLL